MSEQSDAFFNQFLEDFFAECDEHLTMVRRHLLELESKVSQPPPGATVNELFRSFHTVKGLSAMVGFKDAEHLAHRIESYLRLLRDQQVAFDDQALNALMDGTGLLEQVLAAQRANNPAPDIEPVLSRFSALMSDTGPTGQPAAEPTPAAPPSPAPAPQTGVAPQATEPTPLSLRQQAAAAVHGALERGQAVWRFRFVSDPQLHQRGITVNTIRERLMGIGQVLQAEPIVTPQRGIAFEFLVATEADLSAFTDWQADGLSWEPYHEPEATPAPARQEPPAASLAAESPPSPSPATGTGLTAVHAALTSSNVVRVDLARLDELMRLVGELVVTRSRLEDRLDRLEATTPGADWRVLQDINATIERQLRDLREGVMRVRMVPIGETFERMQFVVRDLARERGIDIALEVSGRETEIDKYLVERMMDPLLHLVRNAISHGLEPAEERLAQGKAAQGQIALRASTAGDSVVIEVEDDGRGVDLQGIAAQARAAGLIEAEAEIDAAEALNLICTPGFSTSGKADRASGRGVGMDVVQQTVRELGGLLEMETEPQRGTRFIIHLPLTLAIVDALIVAIGGQRFAVPLPAVHEVIEVDPATVRVLERNEIIPYRKRALPLIRLGPFFGLEEQWQRAFYALVTGAGLKTVGLAIDQLLGQREIVVRSIVDPLAQVPGIAGATELGDGRAVLILDTAAIVRAYQRAHLTTW